jgi:hypothetical protein
VDCSRRGLGKNRSKGMAPYEPSSPHVQVSLEEASFCFQPRLAKRIPGVGRQRLHVHLGVHIFEAKKVRRSGLELGAA